MQVTTAELSRRATVGRARTPPLEPHVADRLLDLLSTDDSFRSSFTQNPRSAVIAAGFDESVFDNPLWRCKFGVQLASKAQILQARTEIRAMLLRGLDQTTPRLDANTDCSRYSLAQ